MKRLVAILSPLALALAGCPTTPPQECQSDCTAAGETACADGKLKTCATSGGCLKWSEEEACAEGFCADEVACGACQHECLAVDATDCTAGEFRTCVADAHRCRAWGEPTACPTGKCDGDTCAGCSNACPSGGATECTAGKLRTCQAGTGGCLSWSAQSACASGFCASAAACGTCSNTCAKAGDTQCSAGKTKTCQADANGCLAWGAESACADGFCASATACGTCADTCPQEGDTQCSAGKTKTCLADANGCLAWGAESACPGGFCASQTTCGTCTNGCTTAGATACASGKAKTCQADANGCRAWSAETACAGGFCASATACGTCTHGCTTAGATECAGGQVRSCVADANGCRGWTSWTACSNGACGSATACAACTDGCPKAGDTQCASGKVSTCAIGTGGCLAWGTASNCASSVCQTGSVCDQKPVAALTCPAGANVGDAVTFDASQSTDADGTLAGYSYAFGDGATSAAGAGATAQHAFSAAGSYTATVTVTDDKGATGTATCTVAVSAPSLVKISEVLYRATGTDYDVFVELHGPAGASLANHTLVGVNGSDGADYNAIALTGTIPADGYFVIAHPNAKTAILSQADVTSTKVDFQNGPDSIQLRNGTTVLDAVGYGTFTATDHFAGEGTAAPDTLDDQSLTRDAACTDTNDNLTDFHTAVPTPGKPAGAANLPPNAALACPSSGFVGQALTFSGSASTDPDGTVAGYAYDFGDGGKGSGVSTTHAFAAAGTFTVTLTVTDDLGATAQASCDVAITVAVNQPPVAKLTCPASGTQGAALTLDASQSSDPDGSVVLYAFDFGDGTAPASGAATSVQHAYASRGSFTATLTVTDDKGATNQATCSLTITLPDLTISASRELCGEQHLGKLIIQGGAKVTCSTGALTVYADDISIDPASSIDLSAVSTDASGASYNYYAPVCVTEIAYTGAGGGGNKTAGENAKTTVGCNKSFEYGGCLGSVCGVTYSVTGASGGSAQGSLDLDAPLGGSGGSGCNYVDINNGSCNASYVRAGGKGGGALKLIAARTLVVYGALKADGGAGINASNYGAGSGGGAGGSIVLASADVMLSGTLSAAGALGGTGGTPSPFSTYPANGGKGGEGWVKIAYGTKLTNTATVTGTTAVVSVTPPLSITSSTHPDPALSYNDGFSQLSISWLAPFASAQGYWSLIGSRTVAVTPTNSTFGTGLTASFPAATILSGGASAFSIVGQDATAAVGTLANRFLFNVNKTAHTVASSSHASSTTWYPGTAIALTWTPPANTTAASFPAFWYRLDRVSDTSPANAKAQWTRTANAGITLTQDAGGQAISGFAYYFHLVAEDTQGNLTQKAAHFLVQVGATAPAKVSFFGYVKDGGGTAVSGAAVKLEPYGLAATTDTNGYFILNNVYAGPYAISATKAGFTTLTSTVSVDAAASPWNGTLLP
ncbi:MAG TPA: PKD domain-containing protein [Myxococcales bacterium]|jgi:PKD repeat protein